LDEDVDQARLCARCRVNHSNHSIAPCATGHARSGRCSPSITSLSR
jgi:hypothetical protein